MARVLAVLCSGRKGGYTAGMLQAAVKGIESLDGIQVEVVHLFDYHFRPCKSCFHCIRDPAHICVQKDAFWGEGGLYQKVISANSLFIADAVHFWGPTAMCHLFFERLYPFLWSGQLDGMPLASVSCASNQGMQILATKDICKWAFGLGMRYIGGLPVHLAYYERARGEVESLGRRLAEAALKDERGGRQKHANDEERFLAYRQTPWRALKPYLQNLTNDTYEVESSLIAEALRDGTFQRHDAVELLEEALPLLEKALSCYKAGEKEEATRWLVQASAYWTHATWKEFLEEEVVRTRTPEVYRPLPQALKDS